MKVNWPAWDGQGSAFIGPDISSLPRDTPNWVYSHSQNYGLGVPLIYDNIIYTKNGENVFALDINTGGEIWKKEIPDSTLAFMSSVNNNGLYMSAYVLDRITGDTIIELNEKMFNSEKSIKFDYPRIFNGHIYFKSEGDEDGYLVFNLNNTHHNSINIDKLFICTEHSVYGLKSNSVNSTTVMRLSDDLIEKIWITEIDVYFEDIEKYCACLNNLYLTCEKELLKIDINSGDIIWRKNLANYSEQISNIKFSSGVRGIAACYDMCFINTADQIIAIDAITGDKRWLSKKLHSNSGVCIAGDLIFCTDYRKLIAFDRYSGEEVWELKDTRLETRPIMAVDGSIIVVTKDQNIQSYNWDQNNPYFSPNKKNLMA